MGMQSPFVNVTDSKVATPSPHPDGVIVNLNIGGPNANAVGSPRLLKLFFDKADYAVVRRAVDVRVRLLVFCARDVVPVIILNISSVLRC